MNRRDLFPILTAAALPAAEPAGYQPRALTPAEYALVKQLANLILPADATSAGAGDAGAAFFIDTLLHHATAAARDEFRGQLKPLLGLTAAEMDAALARLAQDELKPNSFFARLKTLTIDAYCLTPEGRQFLRYTGDRAIEHFEGCGHPEHLRA